MAIGACLLAPFVAMLWVGSYARTEPALAGVPFFYWYQMLWVPLSAALMTVAYVLMRRDRAARRAAELGGDRGRRRAVRSTVRLRPAAPRPRLAPTGGKPLRRNGRDTA